MSNPITAAPRRVGRLHELRARWFGEKDPVAEQLRDIARQGSSMARLAHVCAFALVVLFSLGSLAALGGDALATILDKWQRGQLDVPAGISVAVSTLLVVAMDVGMVYAASMLRLLSTRQAEQRQKLLHQLVVIAVALLESGTYVYMSWRYETPTTLAEWGLIVARGLAAPALSVYLSMARPLPVTARDVLYQAELAAGQGVIRDVVEAASDQGAPLADKISLYGAAATMTPHDRARLDQMIRAVESRRIPVPTRPTLPTGPGTPTTIPAPGVRTPTRRREPVIKLVDPESVRTPRRPSAKEIAARRVWQQGMSVRTLADAVGVRESTAHRYIARFEGERDGAEVGQVAQ